MQRTPSLPEHALHSRQMRGADMSAITHKQSSTLSVQDWRDKRADERLWMLTKADLSPTGVLIVRHAGNSIWRGGASITRINSELFGIELVTAGNLHFIQDGKEYIVEPGHIFIKRRGGNHIYEPGPAGFVHKRFVRLEGPIIEAIIGELGLDRYDVCRLLHPAGFIALQKEAVELIRDQPENYAMRLSIVAFQMLLFVAKDILEPPFPPPITVIIDYMRKNLHRKITIAELTRETSLSGTPFFRLFKSYLNQSPLAYFNAMKMRRAAELLKHTILPIKEIAFSLGYDEAAYFTNHFRSLLGVSPREFRKRMETGPEKSLKRKTEKPPLATSGPA
jgi:AraC-like DNA-binding protein